MTKNAIRDANTLHMSANASEPEAIHLHTTDELRKFAASNSKNQTARVLRVPYLPSERHSTRLPD
jgi:hypothetical protein